MLHRSSLSLKVALKGKYPPCPVSHPASALDKKCKLRILRTQYWGPRWLPESLWGILIDQEPRMAARGGGSGHRGQDTQIFARLSQLIAKYWTVHHGKPARHYNPLFSRRLSSYSRWLGLPAWWTSICLSTWAKGLGLLTSMCAYLSS